MDIQINVKGTKDDVRPSDSHIVDRCANVLRQHGYKVEIKWADSHPKVRTVIATFLVLILTTVASVACFSQPSQGELLNILSTQSRRTVALEDEMMALARMVDQYKEENRVLKDSLYALNKRKVKIEVERNFCKLFREADQKIMNRINVLVDPIKPNTDYVIQFIGNDSIVVYEMKKLKLIKP